MCFLIEHNGDPETVIGMISFKVIPFNRRYTREELHLRLIVGIKYRLSMITAVGDKIHGFWAVAGEWLFDPGLP